MSTGIGITGNGQIQQNTDKQQQLQMHYQQQFAKNQQAQIQKVRKNSGTSSFRSNQRYKFNIFYPFSTIAGITTTICSTNAESVIVTATTCKSK